MGSDAGVGVGVAGNVGVWVPEPAQIRTIISRNFCWSWEKSCKTKYGLYNIVLHNYILYLAMQLMTDLLDLP